MPKHASAKGGAMPAEGHPDAALFALVETALAADRRRSETNDARETAEERSGKIQAPAAVIKTEADSGWLFLGEGIGNPYGREEIDIMRAWHRVKGRDPSATPGEFKVWVRASDILDAWGPWQEALRREEEQSGLAAAERAYFAAADEHDKALTEVVNTRAQTIDGVMAKVKAAANWLPLEQGFAQEIREGLGRYGPDDDVLMLSITRDLLALAGLLSGRAS